MIIQFEQIDINWIFYCKLPLIKLSNQLIQHFSISNIMLRVRSAVIRRPAVIENELEHQSHKNKILEQDRRHFLHQAQEIKTKYNQEIENLKNENKKLKNIRDQFVSIKKVNKGFTKELNSTGLTTKLTLTSTNENFLRIALDKEKHQTKKKKQLLFTLQDKLKDIEENKFGYVQENPMMRTIRELENKLDKVMVKYNEAQSIQQTYEEVVNRLKEQRIGYDNQLASIENCLKGKQHDFQELLLLSHDATHAKEEAYAQMKRFQLRKGSVKDMRIKYVNQKRLQINSQKPLQVQTYCKGPRSVLSLKTTAGFMPSYKQDQSYQRQQLLDYEDALRKLKKVTGVSDANQIIQKFKTQGLTSNTLEDLQSTYAKKIQNLKVLKDSLRTKIAEKKFMNDQEAPQKRRLDQIQSQHTKLSNQYERANMKYQKIASSMISVIAGVKHLKSISEFYKVQNQQQEGSLEEDLRILESKLSKIYDIVKSDPNYARIHYRNTLDEIQAFMKGSSIYEAFQIKEEDEDVDYIEQNEDILI